MVQRIIAITLWNQGYSCRRNKQNYRWNNHYWSHLVNILIQKEKISISCFQWSLQHQNSGVNKRKGFNSFLYITSYFCLYVVGVIHSFQCQPLFSLALRWPTQIICPQMFYYYVLLINYFFLFCVYKYINYVRICPWKSFVEIDSQRKICTLQEDVIKVEKLDLLLC